MYRGYYINLAKNEQRRQAFVERLEAMGGLARYERFEAIDGRAIAEQYPTQLDPGGLGLWLGHLKLLEANAGSDVHLHFVEDDAIFGANALDHFDWVLAAADVDLPEWDLIFTDVLVAPRDFEFFLSVSNSINVFEQTGKLQALDLKSFAFSCTSSFFINKRSISKYASLIAEQWRLAVPLDIFIRRLVRADQLKAFVTVPFLTSVTRDSLQSDIRGGQVNRSLAMLDAYRRMFFQNADLAAIDAELQQLIAGTTHSPRRVLYLKALLFFMSDQWENQ